MTWNELKSKIDNKIKDQNLEDKELTGVDIHAPNGKTINGSEPINIQDNEDGTIYIF